jgi:hypothetical protein
MRSSKKPAVAFRLPLSSMQAMPTCPESPLPRASLRHIASCMQAGMFGFSEFGEVRRCSMTAAAPCSTVQQRDPKNYRLPRICVCSFPWALPQQFEQARAGYPDRIDLTWVTSDRYHCMQSTVLCLSLDMQTHTGEPG